MLRLTPGLHAALREAARREGVSLNDHCMAKLAGPGAGSGPAPAVVATAAAMFREDLLGALAYGSWARGELAADSDIDLLLVVSDRLAIRRDLYRRWEAEASPLSWDGHRVEPHFVHFPERGARISAVWAEAAMEGVVLFDPSTALAVRLVEIRRRIMDGELTRRTTHGQPYWVEAAH